MDNQPVAPHYKFEKNEYRCSLALTLDLIGGKYKSLILFHLKDGAMRSSELQKTIEGITNRMFALAVRELEANHLITRTVFPEVPPKVEYQLTPAGESLMPLLFKLDEWGKQFIVKP